ncbi:MAG TPA: SCO family protein [Bryobacteraceae bacterium]|nr:SCO family protein [Bryobacteraceae bacterium]
MFCTLSKRRAAGLACAGFVLLSGCARHYRAQGIVLAVDPVNRTVTISHKAIPGYMEAMAMPFHVEAAEKLDQLRPGSRVEFQLRVNRESTVARKIRLQQIPSADFQMPKAEGKVAIGEPMPDFTLLDQDGRAVKLSQLRGQLVAVDFIYTRCPLPDVCPRLSANFARLQKRFGGKMTLLSITLDPEYDTPSVLTDYAHRWRADPNTWLFLTGPADDVRKVAGHFGVVYWPEEGTLTHTSSTAIIDRNGRLAALVEGSSFSSQQLIDLVETELKAGT